MLMIRANRLLVINRGVDLTKGLIISEGTLKIKNKAVHSKESPEKYQKMNTADMRISVAKVVCLCSTCF